MRNECIQQIIYLYPSVSSSLTPQRRQYVSWLNRSLYHSLLNSIYVKLLAFSSLSINFFFIFISWLNSMENKKNVCDVMRCLYISSLTPSLYCIKTMMMRIRWKSNRKWEAFIEYVQLLFTSWHSKVTLKD